VKKAKESLYF